LIVRCCDEHGKALFNKTDRLELLHHVSPQVVCRVLAQMGELDTSLDELSVLRKKSRLSDDTYVLYALAERLHKSVSEILQMRVD